MEQNYKLICLDLDGTLLNSKKNISRETLQVLRMVEDRGVNLAIATGRPGYEAEQHARLISDRAFYIGSNGAVVGSLAEDSILSEELMQKENVKKLLDLVQELGIAAVFFTPQQTVVNSIKEYAWHLVFNLMRGQADFSRRRLILWADKFTEYLMRSDVQVLKATFAISDGRKAKKFRSELERCDSFELSLYRDIFHEVTEKGMNKSRGIRVLMEYLDVCRQEVMAFGDSENDSEMLKFVGHGVAMGNAIDSIKAVADTVTDSNDHDGVAMKLKEVYSLS